MHKKPVTYVRTCVHHVARTALRPRVSCTSGTRYSAHLSLGGERHNSSSFANWDPQKAAGAVRSRAVAISNRDPPPPSDPELHETKWASIPPLKELCRLCPRPRSV